QPQPETEEVLQRRMQLQRAVRGKAVQVDGDANDGDVSHQQGGQHQLPDRKIENADLQYQGVSPRKILPPEPGGVFIMSAEQENHNQRKEWSRVFSMDSYNVRQFTLQSHIP